MVNEWFKAIHLIGLVIYLGGLLNLSRMLGYHVKESAEVRARLSWMEKRMYFFVTLPGLGIAVIFGVLMLLGVGTESSVGEAISYYFKPRTSLGEKSAWFVTFHIKGVAILVLLALDFYLGRQIVNLAKGGEPPSPVRFKILHGMIALVTVLIIILMVAGPVRGN
jgi:uncharacterized integral membrane protein (TIGR00701 family)